MAPRIFITGIAGYIGGQLLASLTAKHPEYSIVGLVRSEEQHTADSDHISAITSWTSGLSAGGNNGAYIHLSRVASVLDVSNGFGLPSKKVWDDVDDLHEILTFDTTHFHAASDQLVLSEGKRLGVKTIIAAPPMVYGRSDGIKPLSIGLPLLVDMATKRGKMFRIGEGKQIASSIHVKDLADVLALFIEQALALEGGKAEWGEKGVYYVEGGSTVFADIVDAIAKMMSERGILKSSAVESLSAEEVNKMHPYGAVMWGSNARVQATRLRGLGWTPKQPSVIEAVSDLLL